MPVAKKVVLRQVASKKENALEINKLTVETVPIDSLKLWKDNPRKNDDAVPKLAELLKVHGQQTPIVVWRKNNVVYKGNTTLKALKLLKAKTVNVIFADFKSEQAAIAYGIADNKSSEFAAWDNAILVSFLNNATILSASGFDTTEYKEISLFEASGIIENNLTLSEFILFQSKFGEQINPILNYSYYDGTFLYITNLEIHIKFEYNIGKKCKLVNLVLLELDNCTADFINKVPNDFPLIKDTQKQIELFNKNTLIDFKSFLPFFSIFKSSQKNLRSLIFDKDFNGIIATDGIKAKILKVKFENIKKSFGISLLAVEILSMVENKINKYTVTDSYLYCSGTNFTISIPLIKEELLQIEELLILKHKIGSISIMDINILERYLVNDIIYISTEHFIFKTHNNSFIKIKHIFKLTEDIGFLSYSKFKVILNQFTSAAEIFITPTIIYFVVDSCIFLLGKMQNNSDIPDDVLEVTLKNIQDTITNFCISTPVGKLIGKIDTQDSYMLKKLKDTFKEFEFKLLIKE